MPRGFRERVRETIGVQSTLRYLLERKREEHKIQEKEISNWKKSIAGGLRGVDPNGYWEGYVPDLNALALGTLVNEKYVIDPRWSVVRAWVFLTSLLLLYLAIFTPVEVSYFSEDLPRALTVVNYFVDACFIVDLILNFFLGYYDVEHQVRALDVALRPSL